MSVQADAVTGSVRQPGQFFTSSVSRTDGSSKAGVTTTTAPVVGMIAAVVRSERRQRMPVK